MNRYITYCTTEQTRKALELGAQIEKDCSNLRHDTSRTTYINDIYYCLPTSEEMIGWLEQNTLFKCIQVSVDAKPTNWMYAIYYGKDGCISLDRFSSRKEATLAAIDAALEYLSKNKK